jgi:hypothetical protein
VKGKTKMMRIAPTLFKNLPGALFTLVLLLPVAAQAQSPAEDDDIRAMAVTVEAVVTEIDKETRQVSLDNINIGDRLVATYVAALEGEVREPTAEELAEPWVVVEDAARSADPDAPAVGGARMIRAVCTIEGMNRLLGTVVIKDPRGKVHVIADVEAEKMEGVTLGQTVVMVFTEALALSLEHAAPTE